MQKREKNRSAELTKLREELSGEMEEKMAQKYFGKDCSNDLFTN